MSGRISLASITDDLRAELRACSFGSPVEYVYQPLEYAWPLHQQFLSRFGEGSKKYLLVGMNPGPWGMAQTGIPFGAVSMVRDWLRLGPAAIGRPEREHSKRPVLGLACPREEISGHRLWGWARDHFSTPERFFEHFWVTNYCPLLFLDHQGRNLTPDKIDPTDRAALDPPCARALARMTELLEIELVVGVGVWSEKQARRACSELAVRFGRILHPSPASPAANRDWSATATTQLQELGVRLSAAGGSL